LEQQVSLLGWTARTRLWLAALLVLGIVAVQFVGSADRAYAASNSYYSVVIDTTTNPLGTVVRVTPKTGFDPHASSATWYAKYQELVPATYEGQKYRDQLVCHIASAGTLKVPWNLDSWRPNVGYTATVLAACNP
jgi:hypothetical protein